MVVEQTTILKNAAEGGIVLLYSSTPDTVFDIDEKKSTHRNESDHGAVPFNEATMYIIGC